VDVHDDGLAVKVFGVNGATGGKEVSNFSALPAFLSGGFFWFHHHGLTVPFVQLARILYPILAQIRRLGLSGNQSACFVARAGQ
jgi:hypothetical protein